MTSNHKIKPRNPVARSPLMKKGGVHEKSKTVVRRGKKAAMNKEVEDWRDDVEFERSLKSSED